MSRANERPVFLSSRDHLLQTDYQQSNSDHASLNSHRRLLDDSHDWISSTNYLGSIYQGRPNEDICG